MQNTTLLRTSGIERLPLFLQGVTEANGVYFGGAVQRLAGREGWVVEEVTRSTPRQAHTDAQSAMIRWVKMQQAAVRCHFNHWPVVAFVGSKSLSVCNDASHPSAACCCLRHFVGSPFHPSAAILHHLSLSPPTTNADPVVIPFAMNALSARPHRPRT